MVILIVIVIVILVAGGGYFFYWKQQVDQIEDASEQTFKQLESLMKSRYEVIDTFAIAVRGFTRKEMRTLERVKRTLELAIAETTTPQNISHTENNMIKAVNMLQENCPLYPDLMASPHFQNVEKQLMALEGKIRQYADAYNNLLKQHNALLEGMPGSIFASLSATKPLPYFILDPVNTVGTPVQHSTSRSASSSTSNP
jgi:hypothetical protein